MNLNGGIMFKFVSQKIKDLWPLSKSLPSDDELREMIKAKGLNHIAFIPDGNRRWAKGNGLTATDGHREGFVEATPRVCMRLWKLGVHTVTIWGSSIANLTREKEEVENFFTYCELLLQKMLPIAHTQGIKIIHLGRKDLMPDSTRMLMEKAEKETITYSNNVLNLAINFSGRDDIVRACKRLCEKGVGLESITEDMISQTLDTASQSFPEPDLIVRTAGEYRLSGFMMWQSLYAEFFYTHKNFPEIDNSVLAQAIVDFGHRQRTFSK